jgi:hypothetical protein
MVEQIDVAYADAAAAGQDARPVHVHDAVHLEEADGVRAGRCHGGRGGRGAGRRHGSGRGGRGGGRDLRVSCHAHQRCTLVLVGAGRSMRRILPLLLLLCRQGFTGLGWAAERPVRDGVNAHPPELLLDVCVPVVLDLVVRPPGEPSRDLGPPAQKKTSGAVPSASRWRKKATAGASRAHTRRRASDTSRRVVRTNLLPSCAWRSMTSASSSGERRPRLRSGLR